MRGGEAILDAICELYPEADLFTLLQTDFKMSPRILNGRKVHTSYLQKLMKVPRFAQGYRSLLPIFPHAISTLDLSSYDLILSNTHCVAKGVRKRPDALHIAYVSTPMRYVWDMFDEYFGPGRAGFLTRFAAKMVRKPLQRWDVKTTAGVDYLIANSNFVAERIKKYWHRESTVIHPFAEVERFNHYESTTGGFYLIVSAFAPYKRIDLAVEAFRRNGLQLRIVGRGQEERKLRALAAGAENISFLGGISNEATEEMYRRCKALIFPGLEDFGITPIEALLCGRPVVAYGAGGVLDTVENGKTGVFFLEQTVEALVEAVSKIEQNGHAYSSKDCRARGLEFSRDKFLSQYSEFVARALRARG